jgi:acetylornithine/N-succinyldiaminopimelate aminotransferase
LDITQLDGQYIANTYARSALTAISGEGAVITDENGKEYIDLSAGIAVNTFGVNDEIWKAAVTAQINALQHISNLYYTEPQVKLAKALCEKTGMKKVFFGNSGAEANECAIKAARKYSSDKYGSGRHIIITLENSFHGRTIATLSATGQESMHVHFGPFLEGFRHVPADDKAALESALTQGGVCAIMLEIIQGEGGVNVLDGEYVKMAFDICRERDILFIADEVQTGNGRTGYLYASMAFGVKPDIITTAKGLGGGLPIGVCLLGEKTENTLTAGTHGSTFGGNPAVCAGALSVIERLDETLLAQVREKGEYIRNNLKNAAGVKSVSGMGLMLGIECEKPAKEIAADCLNRGVIVLTAHEKVRLLPPLNISYELLDKALAVLKGVLGE